MNTYSQGSYILMTMTLPTLNGYKDRLIVRLFNKKVVGYTARKVKDGNPKYISDPTIGYVFNLDNQKYGRVYTVVVEGSFDALAVEGVALLGSEPAIQQALLINSLNTKVIVVPMIETNRKNC